MSTELEPFAVVDVPNRKMIDAIRGWTNIVPVPPSGARLMDGVWVESIAEVIYQLPKPESDRGSD